jgi:transcriptional regulator with XRE-family HTH domain
VLVRSFDVGGWDEAAPASRAGIGNRKFAKPLRLANNRAVPVAPAGPPGVVAMTSPHAAFAQRLQLALDLAGIEKGRGRTARLAALYGVSRETARKWLGGLSLPELERMIDMATRFGVALEWLATGRGAPAPGAHIDEPHALYSVQDRDEARLLGLIRRLPRQQRMALLTLLDRD